MKKLLSGLSVAALVVGACATSTYATEPVLQGEYGSIVDAYDWGVGTPKLIVKFAQEIDAISKDDLKVVETKETTDEAGKADTVRTVVDAYLSNENGEKVEGPSQYATVEMKVSPTEGSPFIYKSFNEWANPYYFTVTLNEGKTLTSGETVYSEIDIEIENEVLSLSAGDKFDYDNSYTTTDGTTYSYATYSPEEDDKKNALVVWLHGGGEGGTNSQIAVLGNKVTELASDKTQEQLGGAYVLAPQCPSLWMDGYGDFEFTAEGLKFTSNHGQSKYTESVIEMIKAYVESNDDIDTDRIYVGGCSNGGYMTLQLVVSNPDYFAAAFPVCTGFDGSDFTDEIAQELKDFPLWFTYSEIDDTLTPSQFSEPIIKKLKEAGATNLHVFSPVDVVDTTGLYKDETGNPYKYSTHWTWIQVFNHESVDDENPELELFDWLGQQVKASDVVVPEEPVEEEPTEEVEEPTEEVEEKEEASTEEKEPVQTGDSTSMMMYGMMATAAAVAFVCIKRKEATK